MRACWLIAAIPVAGLLGACQRDLEAAPQVAPTTPTTAVEWSTIHFVPATACVEHWSDRITGRIAFDDSRTSHIGSPLGGRVTRVAVERGQHVAAGAALFVVASADLAALHVQRDRAAVELATARTNVARVSPLVDAGALPAKERTAAEQQVLETRVALDAADRALASLRVQASGDAEFVVTAPQAGTVVDSHLSVGQQVSADLGPVLTIGDVSNVWVYADVLEDATHDLSVGTPAHVTLDSGETIAGTVDQISAVVDPDRHSVPVRLRLDNARGNLRPNAHADLQLQTTPRAAVCVPSTAVLSDGVRHYVYVRQAGVPVRREVVAAHASAGVRAIRRGLALGDEVVAANGALLDNQLPLP